MEPLRKLSKTDTRCVNISQNISNFTKNKQVLNNTKNRPRIILKLKREKNSTGKIIYKNICEQTKPQIVKNLISPHRPIINKTKLSYYTKYTFYF